ncbi:hypothetical protein ACIPSE_04890 [Streptomyces sp. NPDC090106]|uniref:hypothetical protein n=1 Tax=Streptomyces sp. NPDC090106 TaxID=3365946 RepID=UPI003809F600
MAKAETVLLPIGGAALSSDERLLTAVREIGARTGVDYTDDRAVTTLLAERREAAHAAQHRPLAWVAGLTLVAVVCWVVAAVGVPALGPKAAALAGPPLIAAVAALVHVRKGWRREMEHPALAGYREVLGRARAHGMTPTHVPPWLEGRPEAGQGGGKAVLPIPVYPTVEAPAAPVDSASAVPVPPKPAAVAEYERVADTGGWHDEAGCLLVIAGVIGAGWAWSETEPLGYGALALIPLAIVVWLIGSNQGGEKARLRAEATEYVKAITAAQAAGAQVPELSPQLQKLLHG